MLANAVIIAVVVVAATLIIRGYITRGGRGDCCGGADVVRTRGPKDKDASHYAFAYDVTVDGMSCDACAKRVANAFNSLDGTMAEVDLGTGIAHVRTKEPADTDTLRKAVRNEGYGVGAIVELN